MNAVEIAPGSLHPSIESIDLMAARHAAIRSTGWGEGEADVAEAEYRRFLHLRLAYPDAELAPTERIDKMWHAHILCTREYARDCERVFGRFVHHEPAAPGGDEVTERAYSTMRELWTQEFGSPPAESSGARCNGKPCHAPTPCRCR